jgi:hypothetical protein
MERLEGSSFVWANDGRCFVDGRFVERLRAFE